jgi:hypothetical protein
MGMHPMESKDIVVRHVRGKAVKTRLPTVIRKSAVKRLSDPIRSEAVCED